VRVWPRWDGLQSLPDALLESGSAQIKGEVGTLVVALQAADHRRKRFGEDAAIQLNVSGRVFAAQFVHQLRVPAADVDGADTLRRRGNQQLPEVAVLDGIADLHPHSAAAVLRGRHTERRRLVETAAGAVPGVVERGSDRGALAKSALQTLAAAALPILARRDGNDPFEGPLQVVGAEANLSSQVGELQRFLTLFDGAARALHGGELRRRFAGPAAVAGAEAARFGGVRRRKEENAVARGAAAPGRRAGSRSRWYAPRKRKCRRPSRRGA
jgi:hypothetical protein